MCIARVGHRKRRICGNFLQHFCNSVKPCKERIQAKFYSGPHVQYKYKLSNTNIFILTQIYLLKYKFLGSNTNNSFQYKHLFQYKFIHFEYKCNTLIQIFSFGCKFIWSNTNVFIPIQYIHSNTNIFTNKI